MVTKIRGFITLVAVLLLASCRQVEYVHSSAQDTVYIASVSVDTFKLVDSVYHHIVTKDDTVYSTKIKVVYRDRYKYIRDTTYISRVDTVRVPVPAERKATLWEQMRDDLSGLIRLAGLAALIGFLGWFAILRRRKDQT